MKAVPKRKKRRSLRDPRRARLAKVHIARKELGLDDVVYRMILRDEFGAESAADLTNRELDQLIARFESRGWQSRPSSGAGQAQADALRRKAEQVMAEAGIGGRRKRALVQKVCQVADLRFCRDPQRLKRLLAALGKITREERSKPS
ncbi:MAG: DUF1018 domain-containing protein [Desulfobacteraceae bacterium]